MRVPFQSTQSVLNIFHSWQICNHLSESYAKHVLRICRSCVCPILLLNLNQSWNPANLNHRFGIMGEAGNAIHTCHDITFQLPLTLCFWFLFTDDRDEAFLYHLSRWKKHFTIYTSLVLCLISWGMEDLQSHSTDMNSHYMHIPTKGINENSCSGSWAMTCKVMDGETDGHDKAKTCFSAGIHHEFTTINLWNNKNIWGGADKSSARPTSQCHRTELIVPLERGVCSCGELQVFSCYRDWKEACQATHVISTTSRSKLSCFFPAKQGAEGNSRHSDRNIKGTCIIVCHCQKLGGPV